jgi:hypothetical protein
MPDPCRCRYCGQETDRPVIFSLSVQRIMNYIWDNPGCTTPEIRMALYGKHTPLGLINVQICKMRKGLTATDFRLVTKPHPDPASFGFLVRRIMTYKITCKPKLAQQESHDNVPA